MGEVYNQLFCLLVFMITGITIGILFDIFRILRKSFKTADLVTYLQDIAFWILVGYILLFSIFKFNNGEIRSYVFIGIILGVLVYMLTISKWIVKYSVVVIKFVKKIISYPINFIIKIIKIVISPMIFCLKKVKKINENAVKKINYFFKNLKNKIFLQKKEKSNKKLSKKEIKLEEKEGIFGKM